MAPDHMDANDSPGTLIDQYLANTVPSLVLGLAYLPLYVISGLAVAKSSLFRRGYPSVSPTRATSGSV